MTDSGSEDESPQIDLKLKTIQETYDIKTRENANIEKLKRQIAKKIGQPAEKICLIFSGKILKDHETLAQHKIGDGMVIHMVIKNVGKTQPQSRESTPSGSATSGAAAAAGAAPQPQPTIGGDPQLGGMGAMLNNPMVREMINSPFMESFMNNPNMTDMLRTMMAENPQFQQVIQNNPELGHVLNDPRIMQQTLEMIRNPNMFNEMMRNHDQAMRNIQGIPGGEAALHRLYNEVQEPLMNSVLGAPGGGNQFAANQNANGQNAGQNASSRSQHAGVENAEALPNPWSRVVNPQGQQQGTGGTGAVGGVGGAPAGPFAGMMNSPGMQSLMRQILANPAAMQQLFNPDNMRHFGAMIGNPNLAEQFRTGMANPQMMQAMGNPRVFNALMQLQQALQVLHEEMPGVFPTLPGAEIFQNMGGMAAGIFGGANPPAGANSQPTGQAGNQGSAPPPAAPQPAAAPNMNMPPAGFAELLGQLALMNMGNPGAGAGQPSQPPEERYRTQLEQLTAMGFTDQQANIQALLASFGDLNMAIERLLGGGGGAAQGDGEF